LIRPSLCVQAREGRLHVFLPYASRLSDYLDLVAAIEDTCQYLQTPVWLEGYTPPSDPRLRSFSVTPDPGVLEVNLPPASNWDELEQINTLLFEEARRNRLTAEKFTYEGGHVATGGGSHIVVGGAAILDSPFCAVQICCRAWWLSGRTIRRSPISSRACTSGRPASIRAWMKHAPMLCTNLRSRSVIFLQATARPLLWMGYSATYSSMSQETIFLISGPSGSGKTSLTLALLQRIQTLKKIVTFTTRMPRNGEVDGIDYHFVSVDRFRELEHSGYFIETDSA
jgi:hypothetical protein